MTELFGERLREASVDIRDLPRDELSDALPGVRDSLKPGQVAELLRLACGKPVRTEYEAELRQAIKSSVETFPMRGEAQYVAVVALEILIEAQEVLEDQIGSTAAVLCRTAQFAGWVPVHPDLFDVAAAAIRSRAVRPVLGAPRFKAPGRTTATKEALDAVKEEASYATISSALLEVAQELTKVRNAVGQVQENTVAAYLVPIEDQIQILWWLLSGWSHLREAALGDLEVIALAYQVGLDLASLAGIPPGPPAVDALLNQALLNAGSDPHQVITKDELGEGVVDRGVQIPSLVSEIDDLLPTLTLKGPYPDNLELGQLSREVYDEALLLGVFGYPVGLTS